MRTMRTSRGRLPHQDPEFTIHANLGRVGMLAADEHGARSAVMTTDRVTPYVLQPDQAEIRFMGSFSTQFLATGASTGGKLALVDERADKGEAVPLHRHAGDVESSYVLDGEIDFFLGGERGVRASAGSFVHVPAGTVHGFRIVSGTARYLILTTPRHGEFNRAISMPSAADRTSTGESLPAGTIRQATRDYEIEFVGPLPDEVT